MDGTKYIGMDVHKEATTIAVLDPSRQVGDGVDCGNQSVHDSAVGARTAN